MDLRWLGIPEKGHDRLMNELRFIYTYTKDPWSEEHLALSILRHSCFGKSNHKYNGIILQKAKLNLVLHALLTPRQ